MKNECQKKIYLVVPAGGSGSRFGGMKQYADIGGRPLVQMTVLALQNACRELGVEVLGIYVSAPESEVESLQEILPDAKVVVGGASRAESVARAFLGIESGREQQGGIGLTNEMKDVVVAVHDACRPFVSASLMASLLEAVEDADCSVPSLPVTDTLKKTMPQTDRAEGQAFFQEGHASLIDKALPQENDVANKEMRSKEKNSVLAAVLEKGKDRSSAIKSGNPRSVVCTVSRDSYFTVQTPQVMTYAVAKKLYGGRELCSRLTDDSMMAEALGYKVDYVAGDRFNIKITTPDDLLLARSIFAMRPMNFD